MSSKDIDRIVCEYLGEKPGYYIGNYQEILEVISGEEKNLNESDVHEALQGCNFKSPDQISLLALVCPVLVLGLGITERIFTTKIFKIFYELTLCLWYGLVIGGVVSGKFDRLDIVLFGIVLIFTSWSFRKWTKLWNTLELLYQILKTQEKVP